MIMLGLIVALLFSIGPEVGDHLFDSAAQIGSGQEDVVAAFLADQANIGSKSGHLPHRFPAGMRLPHPYQVANAQI